MSAASRLVGQDGPMRRVLAGLILAPVLLAAACTSMNPGAAPATRAPMGSLPVAIIYSFFVEYYVSGMTGAVKE